jgi:hypothetical protein
MVEKVPSPNSKEVLADRAYAWEDFKRACGQSNYKVISPAKKRQKKQPSAYENILLKKYRSRVEHVFAHLKHFRALQVKYNLVGLSDLTRVGLLNYFDP